MLIALALAVTLVVLLFARDVSRAAHNATTTRRSENRSFAALANNLIEGENLLDGRLRSLLANGAGLTRPVFAARLDQLDQQLPGWSDEAALVRSPRLAHDVNDELANLTDQRVADYQALIYQVASRLSLPGVSRPAAAVTDPATALLTTAEQWNRDRFALVKEPGAVRLDALTSSAASFVASGGLTRIESSTSLRLVRAISIAAIRVSPAPLPAKAGELLLPPATSMRVGVSILNASYDRQPVSVSVRVTPLNGLGKPFVATERFTLQPLGAYGFTLTGITTAPSERASLVVVATGAPAAKGRVTREVFHVVLSPSGDTGEPTSP